MLKKLVQQARSSRLFKQSFYGLLFNGLGIAFSIGTIALLLQYMGKTNYGIWITIFAICNWINFLDGGLGNGLRNELTRMLVAKDRLGARQVISTAYISIGVFLSLFFLVLLLVHQFFDWNAVLDSEMTNFNLLALFVFGFFLLQMIFKLLSKIYFAFGMSANSFTIPMLSNGLIFLSVLSLNLLDAPVNLWYVACVYAFAPLFVLSLLSLHFFFVKKPEYRPAFKYYDKRFLNVVLKNGFYFFLIQMSSGVLQAITPFFITLWFMPEITADYQIAVRYYGVMIIALNIILQTLWSPMTKLYLENDYAKLRSLFKKKLGFAGLLLVGLSFLYLVSTYVYSLWLGADFEMASTVNLAAYFFVISVIVSKVFVNFLNATNNIRIQSTISATIIILYIPIAYILVRVLELGVVSLIMTPAIFYLLQMIVAMFEVRKVFTKAKG
jgi:O-antigen/teichoic acid export membrane protein